MLTNNDPTPQGVYVCQDRKSFITEKKNFFPKYRNLYNFRTINLHELYKFTAVHNNIPKEKNTIKMY